MPYIVISPGDVDAESPVSDDLMESIKADLDYLKSAISDGTGASQDLDINKIDIDGAGTAFQLDNNGNVDGNFNVNGVLTTGVFFSSEQMFLLMRR